MELPRNLPTMPGVSAENLDEGWAQFAKALADPQATVDEMEIALLDTAKVIERYLALKQHSNNLPDWNFVAGARLMNALEALFRTW